MQSPMPRPVLNSTSMAQAPQPLRQPAASSSSEGSTSCHVSERSSQGLWEQWVQEVQEAGDPLGAFPGGPILASSSALPRGKQLAITTHNPQFPTRDWQQRQGVYLPLVGDPSLPRHGL